MTEWPTTATEFPGAPQDEAGDAADGYPERAKAADGDGGSTGVAVPDFLRAAMEAAHVDVAAVEQAANDPHVLPTDQEAAFIEAARRESGMRCASCRQPVNPNDKHVLREIVGWSRPREQGGQNHVIDRRETGGLMCGDCAIRLQAGIAVGQESML